MPANISKTRFLALYLGLLIASCIAAVAAEIDLVRQSTGITLPPTILGFARGEFLDFESGHQGDGVGVQYVKVQSYSATVYVYTAGLTPAPTSVDDPAVVSQRADAVSALLIKAKEKNSLARHTGSSVVEVPTNRGSVSVDVDTFIVYPHGAATNDLLLLWVARNKIWKIRVTRYESYRGSETPVAFTRELIRLSVEE